MTNYFEIQSTACMPALLAEKVQELEKTNSILIHLEEWQLTHRNLSTQVWGVIRSIAIDPQTAH